MLIERAHLQNIKCFADTNFSFVKEDGSIAKWVTLLGENATGKTTALQALALSLGGESIWGKYLLWQVEYWMRTRSGHGRISISMIDLLGNHIDNGFLIAGRSISFAEQTKIDGFVAAYGAFRRLARKESLPQAEMPEQGKFANFTTLFDEEAPLATFNQWVSSLDYRREKNDPGAIKMLNAGLNAVSILLPEGVKFDHATLEQEGKIRFLVQGQSISTLALSDGYRSVLALGGDLIWRLLNAYPESENPIGEEGVVLIDELDIHLHPRWQAWIAQKLRSVFPNIQFIVATHSPLVAMGAYWDSKTGEQRNDVLTLKLETNGGKTSVVAIDDDLADMDINRALKSPAFGMVAPRPPEVETKIDRYDALLANQHRTSAEEAEFQALRAFMAEARPIGGKPQPGSFQAKLEAYLSESLL